MSTDPAMAPWDRPRSWEVKPLDSDAEAWMMLFLRLVHAVGTGDSSAAASALVGDDDTVDIRALHYRALQLACCGAIIGGHYLAQTTSAQPGDIVGLATVGPDGRPGGSIDAVPPAERTAIRMVSAAGSGNSGDVHGLVEAHFAEHGDDFPTGLAAVVVSVAQITWGLMPTDQRPDA